MRGIQKLVRNGNSTHVCIPAAVLEWLGWRAGEPIWFETREDESIVIRKPRESDFHKRATAPHGPVTSETVGA